MGSREINSLDQLMDGGLKERFDEALRKLWDNVYDPNCDPNKKRKVILTVAFTPNERRDASEMEVSVKTQLAEPSPLRQTVLTYQHDDGSVSAIERSDTVPGQVDMDGNEFVPKETVFARPVAVK